MGGGGSGSGGSSSSNSSSFDVKAFKERIEATSGTGLIIIVTYDQYLLMTDYLNNLASKENNLIYIVGEQGRDELEGLFRNGNMGLVSEMGSFLYHPLSVRLRKSATILNNGTVANDWIDLADPFRDELEWREEALDLLHFYSDHTPESEIIERERSLIWNFDRCDREYGAWQASELQSSLERQLSPYQIKVDTSSGQRLRIRSIAVEPDRAVKRILADLTSLSIPTNDLIIAPLSQD